VEQHIRADNPVVATAGRTRLGKRLAPYGLIGPGALWLGIYFVIPMFTMLILSLEIQTSTNSFVIQGTGYRFAWHWAAYLTAFRQYHVEFLRSLWYGLAVTLITLIVGYPAAYWIAFHGGRRKTTYLFMILLPFFVSFVIRSLAWQFILSDQGIVLHALKAIHLLPASFHILATSWAVIAGISYNALPFTVLPLYVSLEKIDRSVVEAAKDLYSRPSEVFRKVILPLTVPGIFAAFLLTFVPSVGDYVNASILGGTGTTMIGNVIEFQFLYNDASLGAALSFILMAGLLIGIFAYARVLGTQQIADYL
jgi:spermidine/putrescine transport system permease protein